MKLFKSFKYRKRKDISMYCMDLRWRMAALDLDKKLDIGEYLEYSSQVQADCPWYPPTDASHFPYDDVEKAAMSSESLLMGFNVMTHPQEAYENSPVSKVTPDAPPFLLIHGTKDSTVPFSQSLILIFICTGKPVGSFR